MHVKRIVLCGWLRLVGHHHAVQGVGRQVHPAEGGLVVFLAHSRAGDETLVTRIPSCQLHLAPGHTGHEEVGAVDVPVNPGAVSAPTLETNTGVGLVGLAQFLAVVVEEVDHASHAGSPATLEGGHVGPDRSVGDHEALCHDPAVRRDDHGRGRTPVGVEIGLVLNDHGEVAVAQANHVTAEAADLVARRISLVQPAVDGVDRVAQRGLHQGFRVE